MSDLWHDLAQTAKHDPGALDAHEVRVALLRAARLAEWANSRHSITIANGGDGLERVVVVLDVERGSTAELFAEEVLL